MLKAKLALVATAFAFLAGCSGTTTNAAGTCSTDYLFVPALSIPAMIGACDGQ